MDGGFFFKFSLKNACSLVKTAYFRGPLFGQGGGGEGRFRAWVGSEGGKKEIFERFFKKGVARGRGMGKSGRRWRG